MLFHDGTEDHNLDMSLVRFGHVIYESELTKVSVGHYGARQVVYKVFDTVKYQEGGYRVFFEEYNCCRLFKHENIYELLGSYFSKDMKTECPFLMFEYYECQSLHRCIRFLYRHRKEEIDTNLHQVLDTNEILHIMIQIGRAVEYIHSLGYVHRDVKPDNVFVSKDGDVYLGDFGFCKYIGEKYLKEKEVGTYRYMAPEVYLGKPYSYPADVYSLGMLAVELLTCRVPFSCLDREHVCSLVVELMLKPPVYSYMNPTLVQLISEMCGHDPDARPNISEVIDRLEFMLST